jgi:archaellum component FlaC
MKVLITQISSERDTFREETRDLNQMKDKITQEKGVLMQAYKDKINRLEHKIKRLVDAAEKIEEQL